MNSGAAKSNTLARACEIVPDAVAADIFSAPRSRLGGGIGVAALVGIALAWRDTNRRAGLPPHVVLVVSPAQVLLFEAHRTLGTWQVGRRVHEFARGNHAVSVKEPYTLVLRIGGTDVELSATEPSADTRDVVRLAAS